MLFRFLALSALAATSLAAPPMALEERKVPTMPAAVSSSSPAPLPACPAPPPSSSTSTGSGSGSPTTSSGGYGGGSGSPSTGTSSSSSGTGTGSGSPSGMTTTTSSSMSSFTGTGYGNGTTSTGPYGNGTTTSMPYGNGTTSTASPTMNSTSTSATAACTSGFWLEQIKHQGLAAFNNASSSYTVFRNVKDYGAMGDGVTDDTVAINNAISAGNRCAPGSCQGSTTSPAVVYFPAGTYIVSASIIDYYYTQLIGNANCPPTIKATANFTGIAVIDGDPYGANGLSYGATNVFYRQIRNFEIDTTAIPTGKLIWGIHWPTGQATSLQNIVFQLSQNPGTQHIGVFIESGSGGFMTDLVFFGGYNGLQVGNQQFTMRNMTFFNAVAAIQQLWDWGWTYQGVTVNNCSVGLNMTGGGQTAQTVASITLFDSLFYDTGIAIQTSHDPSNSSSAGSLILENVFLENTPVAVSGAGNTTQLAGTTGTATISAYGEGHSYVPNGPNVWTGDFPANNRPASLTQNGLYYTRSKPQYANLPVSSFLSARSAGCAGDGTTDDTSALQAAINQAASNGQVLFVDQGDYLVSSTITIPAGSKIVGESYSVILGSGSFFGNVNSPQPVVQVGAAGATGIVEWSDMIVSTQGAAAGAILIQWNMASPAGTPSGIWDVHTRIGGFAGSNLQVSQCATTPQIQTPPASVNANCIAAFMSMQVTSTAAGLYMENNWLWTADHDIESPTNQQITIYAGRGLYVETTGPMWLWGTAVEHHTLYQYQFSGANDIYMGQIQTETPYYQPNPDAAQPFATNAAYNDPTFTSQPGSNFTKNATTNNNDAWGLRILNSDNLLIYGAGLYSFFDNYNTSCSAVGNGEACQTHILQFVNPGAGVSVYNLNTVGTTYAFVDGTNYGYFSDNYDGFVDTVALIRPAGSGSGTKRKY